MTTQNSTKQITAKLVKSNASENLVWEIAITNSRSKKRYCKTARKALSYIFFIKKEKQCCIKGCIANVILLAVIDCPADKPVKLSDNLIHIRLNIFQHFCL